MNAPIDSRTHPRIVDCGGVLRLKIGKASYVLAELPLPVVNRLMHSGSH